MDINEKLERLAARIGDGATVRVMIFGLGSVGAYLLDYFLSWPEENVEIHVCGRSLEKMVLEVNICRVANLIRHGSCKNIVCHQLDLNDPAAIGQVIGTVEPDFLVNSSRVYSGLKYGSISWKSLRSYGLWSPLAAKYIRNIMMGSTHSSGRGILINTSYADVVNCWLKSYGLPAPDFGSGNLNHLIPRIKLAVAALTSIDSQLVDVVLATSHFHDVVISKEGHSEGVAPLLYIGYGGHAVNVDVNEIYRNCAIPMPVDSKRNMMNASSNFEIVARIVGAIKNRSNALLHSPGVVGKIGGYPVAIDFRPGAAASRRFSLIETYFSAEEMEKHNRLSISLDGIENVSEGVVTFTAALVEKVQRAFAVAVPRQIHLDSIDEMADILINRIIVPNVGSVA